MPSTQSVDDDSTTPEERERPSLATLLSGPSTLVSTGFGLHYAGGVSWPSVAVGVVAGAVFVGPLGRSKAGRYALSGFEWLGSLGRTALVGTVAVLVWAAIVALEPPVAPLLSFVAGSTAVLLSAQLWRYVAGDRSRVE